uniref:Starch synthase (Maltosyl-transferring) n=1 Tax=Candidatus Kentrum eta TaxID=2126337 RepID=A0A450VBY1_9GAMM|nr:MAG: starch synthase (maltosyl-transferring) [Candidatus Kentron sp. H]VFJ94103.1 MAG: starch synthase (maltosyl-transferring) [Candidatus Kentron sp. H]VFK02271.1 MAG: starch synthase (maltosyl-transferring) [Candidatus Kentron sp. H]
MAGLYGEMQFPKEEENSMRIYNLFPLLAGKFTDWPKHLMRAREMGFDWVFFNPIQRSGRSGSLYSIADYFQMDPRMVDPNAKASPEEQIKAIGRVAEKQGLRLMVDLVINHCAEDSHIVREHPEWFAHEHDGSVSHPFCVEDGNKVVWQDLARFDPQHTSDPNGLYEYCRRIVQYLIGLGFTGFRCDAAYQIPGHFWSRLINDIRKDNPDVVFTAETLGCTVDQTRETAQAGFDYVFNSSKWWDFGSPWLLEQYSLIRESASSISFPESHDTQRLFQEFDGNLDAMRQRYMFSALFSSGVMMPMGFEFGFRKPLHVVQTRPEDWEDTGVDISDFIRDVNRIKADHAIFQEDCPTTVIGYDNPGILLMWKASARSPDEGLIILNKDPWNRQHFYVDNLRQYVQAGAPLRDVSPSDRMEFLPEPFSYELRPGECRALVTSRNSTTTS